MRLPKERKYILSVFAAALIIVTVFVSTAFGATGLDDDVKLLLRGNVGNNIVTTLRDSSFSDHTVTLNGGAYSVRTVPEKFSQYGNFSFGSYLEAADADALDFGTGDFTIDAWVFPQQGASHIAVKRNMSGVGTGAWGLIIDWNGELSWKDHLQSGTDVSTSGAGITPGRWYHVAVTRSGTTLRMFVNGVQKYSGSNSLNYTNTFNLNIGRWDSNGTNWLNGAVDEFRISKGTARWTSDFTPPTAPHSSDANTSLLLHMDGSAGSTTFTDSSSYARSMTRGGSAVIGVDFVKFGERAVFFDGSGDYILLDGSSEFAFGTDDFAIDFWFNPSSFQSGGGSLFNTRASCGAVTNTLSLERSGTGLLVYASGATRITGGTLTLGTWHHIALTRSGTNTKLFLDGVQVGSTYTDANNYVNNTSRPSIGICGDLTSQPLAGYLDEYRVSKGVARWTSNFTPPTEEYGVPGTTLVGNVLFLRNIAVIGSLSKGGGTFVIDHPQKPRTHLLYHAFVESPEAKNIYDGIVELDANGEAIIALPDYFEALNKDFRYQYFPLDEAMPNLHVKEKVKNNQFVLAGGKPGGRVSWQVTGIRHDPYIEANPIRVEVDKGPGELVDKGECLHEVACQ